MPEFTPANIEEIEKGEKWYLKRILESIENDNLEEVLVALNHAWSSAYVITDLPVNVNEGIYNPSKKPNFEDVESLEQILEEYFEDKIKSGVLDVDDRIRIYKKILPYDIDLAHSLIKKIEDDSEYSVGSYSALNPEELEQIQISHYQYIIDQDLSQYQLYEVLKADGHFDEEASYNLSKELKDKIIKYAKEYIDKNPTNKKDFNFMKSLELLEIFNGK